MLTFYSDEILTTIFGYQIPASYCMYMANNADTIIKDHMSTGSENGIPHRLQIPGSEVNISNVSVNLWP